MLLRENLRRVFSSPLLSSRRKYYVKFCKSVIFVSGLAITHKFVNYAVVSVLITFITNDERISIVNGAALSNMGEAISGLTLIIATVISASYAAHHLLILCSTALYLSGLILFCLRAFHVIALRIPHMIIVVALIQMGKSGSKPILDNFFGEQLRFHDEKEGEEDSERLKARLETWTLVTWLFALVPILIISPHGWQTNFLVSSSLLAFSCVLFLCGHSFYHPINPKLSPPIIALRVFNAAILNINSQYPSTRDKYFFPFDSLEDSKSYNGEFFYRTRVNDDIHLLPHVPFCRWLDKGAIKDSTTSPEEQERKCATVIRVQETKYVLRMVPMWIIFLGFGVARATWNTFFYEQADKLSDSGKISITTLIVMNTISKVSISYLYRWISKRISSDSQKRYTLLKMRIWLGMLMCTVCFIVAWKVEKADPSRKLMVAPQFCLYGFAEGLGMDGLAEFYDYQVPQSMRGYGDVFNGLFTSFGSVLSICFLLASGDKWFGNTLTYSDLYKYYRFVTIVTIIFLLVGSYGLLVGYAYNDDMVEIGHLEPKVVIPKDQSDQEARYHKQTVEELGIDREIIETRS